MSPTSTRTAASTVHNRRWSWGLAAVVAAGLALRLANATTALVHDDEKTHAVGDAMWALSPLPLRDSLRFLREHPRDHPRLYRARGVVEPWAVTRPKDTFWGHPTLSSYLTGLVFLVVRPATAESAVRTARIVSVLADTLALAALPGLVRRLGGSAASGLLAAALYAVFPLAVSSGSIATFDPLLAPLMVLLARTLAAPGEGLRSWVVAGAITGLMIATKETALITLVAVPILVLATQRDRLRVLASWAMTTLVAVALFVSPSAYGYHLLHPPVPLDAAHLSPLQRLLGNVDMLASPLEHFWLGWAKHGSPRAPLLSRLNVYVAPVYTCAVVIGFAVAVLRRRQRELLVLYLPIALTLAFVPPTGAVRRLQMIAPLLCAAIALWVGPMSRRGRAAALIAGLAIAALALLPQRLAASGRLDLADLLFHNPQAHQRSVFFSPFKGRPLVVRVPPGVELSRQLWLGPGTYQALADASGPLSLTLDGQSCVGPDGAPLPVRLDGFVHTLRLSAPTQAILRRVTIRAAD